MRNRFTSSLGVALTVLATSASAACESAFCTLMTDRFAQGTGDAHPGWSADLRLEFVSQTQLRSGTDAAVGQIGVSAALNQQEEFRPGVKFEGSVGWSHAFSPEWGTVLQVNVQHRASDRGAQAEPLNSGSTTVSPSPV